jgi:hypothetical protein
MSWSSGACTVRRRPDSAYGLTLDIGFWMGRGVLVVILRDGVLGRHCEEVRGARRLAERGMVAADVSARRFNELFVGLAANQRPAGAFDG